MTAIAITTFDVAIVRLSDLRLSPLNVRKYDAKDVATLADSIATVGLLQSLLVRPHPDHYEVLGGGRRYAALTKLANGSASQVDVPVIMVPDTMTDADAIALSLEENDQRKAMDPFDTYAAIAAMRAKGMPEDEIARTMRISVKSVRQRIALAKLIPAVRTAYRDDAIADDTLYILTLATKAQQKAYCDLLGTPGQISSYRLRAWILGTKTELATNVALFPLADYTAPISADLFGEESYFTDAKLFWELQLKAVNALRDDLLGKGWTAVEIFAADQPYRAYDYVDAAKAAGGAVHIDIEHDGTVTVYKGRTTPKLARAAAAAANAPDSGDSITPQPEADARAELSVSHANYVDNIRLAAVRHGLLSKPKIATRLLLAHLLAGSTQNLTVKDDPLQQLTATCVEAVQAFPPATAFGEAAGTALRRLGLLAKHGILGNRSTSDGCSDVADLFAKLLDAADRDVNDLLCVATAAMLGLGTDIIDHVGTHLALDIAKHWTADEPFLALVRGRDTANAMLADVAGPDIAAANSAATGKDQRALILTALAERDQPWTPAWLRFPMAQYTGRPMLAHLRRDA